MTNKNIKIPNFVECRSSKNYITKSYVSITKNGEISLYRGFSEKIKGWERCLILLDKEQDLLGMQFGGENIGKGTYKVAKSHENIIIFTGKHFFIMNNINLSEWVGIYKPEEFDIEGRKNTWFIDKNNKIN